MESNHIVNRTFNLQLTTLSPVAINSGKELSPLSDYFVMDGEVNYVDVEKFQRLLLEDKELLDKYENKIVNTEISSADNFLNNLISDQKVLKSISKIETVQYNGGNTILLKEVMKSNTQPYIPGSSIKGAIKNAILYYWLTKSNSKFVEDFVSNNKDLIKESIIYRPYLKKLKFKKNRSNVEDGELRKLKKLEFDAKKSLDNFILFSQNKAFGIKKDIIKQPSSNLKISDTNSISLKDNVKVASLMRKSLREDVNDWILNNQEYIKPNAVLDFQLEIATSELDWQEFGYDSLLKEILQKSTASPKLLFDILNHFSLATANCHKDFKLNIPFEISNANPDETYLSLGSGKGIYRNTVLLAIRSYYEQNGFNFLQDFVPIIANIKKTSEDFPNSVVHIDNNAMGWVKLSYHK